jgi:hypothetical protein
VAFHAGCGGRTVRSAGGGVGHTGAPSALLTSITVRLNIRHNQLALIVMVDSLSSLGPENQATNGSGHFYPSDSSYWLAALPPYAASRAVEGTLR